MFGFYYKHLILIIIRLEFIVVRLLYNIFIIIINIQSISYIIIFVLRFMVCEGALVLTLVVLIVRFYGNDYFNTMRILKW